MRTGRRGDGRGGRRGMEADWGRLLREQRLLVLLAAILLLGELVGAFLSRAGEGSIPQEMTFLAQGFFDARSKQTLLATFGASLAGTAGLLLVAFICGFCAIAQPAALFLPLFRGMGIGLTMGYLYSAYGWRGILSGAALILPNAVLSSVVILLACREALRLSSHFFASAFGRGEDAPKGDNRAVLRLYGAKFGVLLALAVAAALLDSFCTFLFAGTLAPA